MRRPIEKSTDALTILLLALMVNSPFSALIFYTKVTIGILKTSAYIIEFPRLQQSPNLIALIISLLLDNESLLTHILFTISISLRWYLELTYGDGTFKIYPKMKEAPFKVGYQMIRTEKYGNEVQVYYPISKEIEITQQNNVPYLPHDDKTIKGLLLLAMGKILKMDKKGPTFLMNYYKDISLGVAKNAPLSPKLKDKKIVPIFFSHGLTSSPHNYSRVLIDLASNGYIVFGIFHQDGSC